MPQEDRLESVQGSDHPGVAPALETLTSAGTPLLAGFCVTLIGVIAQAPEKFRWPSPAILLLSLAAIAFVISVHCYYWARVHLVESGGAAHRGEPPVVGALDPLRERFAHRAWSRRLHVFFQLGILGLFVGLGTAVWPTAAEPDPVPRALAVGACAAMVLLVLFWTFGFFFLRLVTAADGGHRGARLVLRWFRPGERAYLRHVRAVPPADASRHLPPDAADAERSAPRSEHGSRRSE